MALKRGFTRSFSETFPAQLFAVPLLPFPRLLEGLPSGLSKLTPASLLPAFTGSKKNTKGKKRRGGCTEPYEEHAGYMKRWQVSLRSVSRA